MLEIIYFNVFQLISFFFFQINPFQCHEHLNLCPGNIENILLFNIKQLFLLKLNLGAENQLSISFPEIDFIDSLYCVFMVHCKDQSVFSNLIQKQIWLIFKGNDPRNVCTLEILYVSILQPTYLLRRITQIRI